ncbi:hypothetical protein [Lentzea sp. NPDC055074]
MSTTTLSDLVGTLDVRNRSPRVAANSSRSRLLPSSLHATPLPASSELVTSGAGMSTTTQLDLVGTTGARDRSPRSADSSSRPRLLPSSLHATPLSASSVPASSVPASSVPASSVPASSVPASSVPASSVLAAVVPTSSLSASSVPASSLRAAVVPV